MHKLLLIVLLLCNSVIYSQISLNDTIQITKRDGVEVMQKYHHYKLDTIKIKIDSNTTRFRQSDLLEIKKPRLN